MKRRKFDETFKTIAGLFKLLAHEDRLRIIGLIHEDELDVGSISKATQISQSSVSQHLKMLKLNHLVREKRIGKRVFYKVTSSLVSKIVLYALEFSVKDHKNENKNFGLIKEMKELWAD